MEDQVLVDNRTDLPDELVQDAVATYFVENSSLLGANASQTFQTYATQGGLLARAKYQTPANVYDEIRLARELATRDDDVRATVGMMVATAFADGMQNNHPDEKTVELFNGLAHYMNLDGVFKRIYREWLIAQQVTTVCLFTRRQAIDVGDDGETETMVAPLIGILPSEQVRAIGSDLFGNAELALIPTGKLEAWLTAYFDEHATPARKAELRREDPVSAQLFTGPVELDEQVDYTGFGTRAYRLNPRMAHRTTAPYDGVAPRPLLTADFALLEAKRLLNLMDYALLQGGMNFIVVAKKGTDERPALPAEVENLEQVIRRASRTGVIVGDHRLTIEIITPDLTELLNPEKRKLLGRKIAMGLLRVAEQATEQPAAEGMRAEIEFLTRVISSDRLDMRRHVENYIYEECFQRNRALTKGSPRIWFPKIVLQGANFFTDYVLKLRDRGDIPRKWAVEAAGFDWEAGVEQRKRELKDNIDETMMPAAIPFDGATGPQDNSNGRPKGGSPDNGAPGARTGPGTQDPARPARTINRNAGETIKAVLDEETGDIRRIGERTYAILEEYPDYTIGRVTALEHEALSESQPVKTGPLAIIPVNPRYEVEAVKAVRLTAGLSMMLGTRRDGAVVAKALCFRQPEFDALGAEETALRWGFPIEGWADEVEVEAEAAEQSPGQIVHLHVDTRAGKVKRTLEYDEAGHVVGSVEEEAE